MVVKKPEQQEDTWADEPTNPVTVVQGSSDREYASITFKAGTGYNAPWLVLKPSSMEEAQEMVNHEDLSELLDQIARKNKEFEKAFGGAPTSAKPASSGGWGSKNKPAAKSSQGQVEETDDGYECEHGEAVYKSGKTNGRKWAGYFCPSRDRDEQCKPAFE